MANANDQWRRCRPGQLVEVAERMDRLRQRRQFLRALSAVSLGAATMVGGGLIWSKLQEVEEYRFAGIGCSEVGHLVMSGRHDRLSPEVRKQLLDHIQQCPHCGPKARQMGITPEMLSLRIRSASVA